MVKKFLSLFTLVAALNISAQTGGSRTYEFLNQNTAVPRVIALGGNTIGIKDDDLGNSLQSPGQLSSQVSRGGFFSTVKYLGDIRAQNVAYAQSFDKIGHFEAGLYAVSYAKIDQRDEYGNDLGTIKANDYCFNIMYAKDIDSMWTYGFNLKTIYSQYGQYKSVGNTVDFGVTYSNRRKQATITGLFKNMGYQWKSYTGNKKEKIPFNAQIGASYKVPRAPFRLTGAYDYLNVWDLTYSDPNNPAPTEDPFTHEAIKTSKTKTYMNKLGRHLIPGVEIIITKNFNLRVGFNYKRRAELVLADKQGLAGFSFGAGFMVTYFQFSWAYAQYSPGFGTNYFSISTKFSDINDYNKKRQQRRETKAKEAS